MPPRAVVRTLDWPPEHRDDLRTLSEGLVADFSIGSGLSSLKIVSLDQHKVLDATSLEDARAIFTLCGSQQDVALIVCSYAPVGSPNRPRTRSFVQGLSRYTGTSVSLVHTAAKIHGPLFLPLFWSRSIVLLIRSRCLFCTWTVHLSDWLAPESSHSLAPLGRHVHAAGAHHVRAWPVK